MISHYQFGLLKRFVDWLLTTNQRLNSFDEWILKFEETFERKCRPRTTLDDFPTKTEWKSARELQIFTLGGKKKRKTNASHVWLCSSANCRMAICFQTFLAANERKSEFCCLFQHRHRRFSCLFAGNEINRSFFKHMALSLIKDRLFVTHFLQGFQDKTDKSSEAFLSSSSKHLRPRQLTNMVKAKTVYHLRKSQLLATS